MLSVGFFLGLLAADLAYPQVFGTAPARASVPTWRYAGGLVGGIEHLRDAMNKAAADYARAHPTPTPGASA